MAQRRFSHSSYSVFYFDSSYSVFSPPANSDGGPVDADADAAAEDEDDDDDDGDGDAG